MGEGGGGEEGEESQLFLSLNLMWFSLFRLSEQRAYIFIMKKVAFSFDF